MADKMSSDQAAAMVASIVTEIGATQLVAELTMVPSVAEQIQAGLAQGQQQQQQANPVDTGTADTAGADGGDVNFSIW
jgi:hypothetical protein